MPKAYIYIFLYASCVLTMDMNEQCNLVCESELVELFKLIKKDDIKKTEALLEKNLLLLLVRNNYGRTALFEAIAKSNKLLFKRKNRMPMIEMIVNLMRRYGYSLVAGICVRVPCYDEARSGYIYFEEQTMTSLEFAQMLGHKEVIKYLYSLKEYKK